MLSRGFVLTQAIGWIYPGPAPDAKKLIRLRRNSGHVYAVEDHLDLQRYRDFGFTDEWVTGYCR